MSSFGYDVLGFGSSATTGVVLPSDDEFNRVSFLSHFDGANNGVNNAFDDGSASNHTITAAGNATQGSFGPFARPDGEWSVDFKNTSALALPASSTDFDFGTANFTIECYMRYLGGSSDDSYIISFGGGSGNAGHFGINIYQGNWRVGAFNNDLAGGTAPTDQDWHHVAVVYVSNVFKLYVDGSVVSTSGSDGPFNTTTGAVIGGYWDDSDSNNFNGLISNLRVVKGTAVYTSNFTAPTGPLTAISGTVLLTCQSNRFVDNSSSGHALTPVVSPSVSAFGPFLTDAVYDPAVNGASAYFDGSGDYITCSRNAGTDYQFGSGNFTVEGYFFVSGTGNGLTQAGAIDCSIGGANSNSSFFLNINHNAITGYFSDGAGWDKSIEIANLSNGEQWVHVAWVRNGSTLTIYRNGVSIGTITSFITLGDSTLDLSLGIQNGAGAGDQKWKGYMSDVRLVKGTAVYTGNFTPPTAPLTAITNTKLLLNMADGQAIDSAAQKEWTSATVWQGTPKLATAQSKFGDTSLYFNNSSVYTIPAGLAPQGGTADYTMEFWWRTEGTPDTNDTLFMDSNEKFFMQFGDDGDAHMWAGDANLGQSFSVNTWYHAAFVRNGSTVNWYHNGTAVGSGLSVGTMDTLGTLYMGAQPYDGGRFHFQGWVDEMRISRFARYTSNFTPATEPFPDKGQ